MTGDEQGHQLVADLLLAHRRAVLVARLEQHREDVVALGALAPAARRSARRSSRRPPPAMRTKRAKGPTRSAARASRLSGFGGIRLIGRSPKASISCSRSRSASKRAPGLEPEDRAQDDLQRQLLHPRVQLDRRVARQRRDLLARSPPPSARSAAPCARRGRPAASACAAPCARPRRAGSPSCCRRSARAPGAPLARAAGRPAAR